MNGPNLPTLNIAAEPADVSANDWTRRLNGHPLKSLLLVVLFIGTALAPLEAAAQDEDEDVEASPDADGETDELAEAEALLNAAMAADLESEPADSDSPMVADLGEEELHGSRDWNDDNAWAEDLLAQENGDEEDTMAAPSTSRLSVFLFGAGLVVIVGWFLTKRNKKKLPGGGARGSFMKHVHSLRLGPKQHISIVEIQGRMLLVGVAEQNISLLTELDYDSDMSFASELDLATQHAEAKADQTRWEQFLNRALKGKSVLLDDDELIDVPSAPDTEAANVTAAPRRKRLTVLAGGAANAQSTRRAPAAAPRAARKSASRKGSLVNKYKRAAAREGANQESSDVLARLESLRRKVGSR